MGNSLQNALKKALAGKHGKLSSRAEKSSTGDSTAKEKDSEPASLFSSEQIDAAQSFSELMEQVGVSALGNGNNSKDGMNSPPAHPTPEKKRETRRIRKYVFSKKQQRRSGSAEST